MNGRFPVAKRLIKQAEVAQIGDRKTLSIALSKLFRQVIQQALPIFGPVFAALERSDDFSPNQPRELDGPGCIDPGAGP
jgi:hypothetical protein